MKILYIVFILMSFPFILNAEPYTVCVETELNVRTLPSAYGNVVGKLYNGDIIEVSSIESDWAAVDFNGYTRYVKAQYITPTKSNSSKSSSFWDFNWITSLPWWAWVILVPLIIIVVYFLFAFVLSIVSMGLVFGILFSVVGLLIYWFGWIEISTVGSMFKWGFYIGLPIGFIYSICNPGSVMEVMNKSEGGRSVDNSWKEHYSFYDENGHYVKVESEYKTSPDKFRDPSNGDSWERQPNGSFVRRN